MIGPIFAYDPKTGEYAGSFYDIDPAERGLVVTKEEGWLGAIWDGSAYVQPPDEIADVQAQMIDTISWLLNLTDEQIAIVTAMAKG